MLNVYFSSKKEVISFCEYLFGITKQIDVCWQTNEDWGNQLQIKYQLEEKEMVDAIAKSMVEVFTTHRLTTTIEKLIKEKYYYSNRDEIERIIDLTQWIIFGDDKDSLYVRNHKMPTQLLYSLFLANIQHATTVHYDSIVQFRLKVFRDELIHYIGLAIDEFKREEDHQTFIHTLREYISKRKATYDIIHVMQGSPFTFFKPNGERFTKRELKKLMQKEPLYIVGLDGEEMNLAPLIAIAPSHIKIYGDHPSEPKTLTVINVFQEKVDFLPVYQFPFSYNT